MLLAGLVQKSRQLAEGLTAVEVLVPATCSGLSPV
jgi:hypothetical protein